MLTLILGIAGTGKTTRLLQQMDARAQAKSHSLLLVPEQFSSSAESIVYKQLGDAKSAFVEVASFRTLAQRILKNSGGINTKVMNDAARAVFVRRALDALGEEAKGLSRHRFSASFCAMCAETIAELKTAGASPDVLRAVAARAGEPKLAELALLYAAYETGIQNVAMDPQDRLSLAASKAACGYFAGKACFIDNFDGFTTPEYEMLAEIVGRCEETYVALCCDGLAERDGGLGRFSPVRRTGQHLLRLAAKAGARAKQPVLLTQPRRCATAGPAAVNLLLGYSERQALHTPDGLTLTPCPDEWEEVRLAAAEMHRLAQSGVPYSRMALVCRDIAHYESSVRRAFGLFGIPLFIDAPATIEYAAPVTFLRAALRLLREGLVSGPILALLKTGLCGFEKHEIAALENYVYTWAPKAADWRAPFANNPGGLMARMDEESEKQLRAAEAVRGALIPKLESFMAHSRGKNGAGLTKQLYLLLEAVHAAENDEAEKAALSAGGETYAAEARRAWDFCMDLLDQMVALVGTAPLSAAEYDELFLLLVRTTDFGRLPQALECAIFTSADRMRLADPDYCFVVGLCEDEFPRQVGFSGLLTHTDRELLVEAQIEMPGSFENRVLLEEMFFYRALTAPRKGLYLSWPARRGGAVKSMASALEGVRLALRPPPLVPSLHSQAATPAAAFERLAGEWHANTETAATLYAALQNSGVAAAAKALEMLLAVDHTSFSFKVADTQAVQRLVGSTLTLSATRTERFYECNFSYFMERVLRVLPRRKAELSPMESGTFVHYILEQVLADAGAAFKTLADEELAARTQQCAEAFIKEYLPQTTRRAGYILGQIILATTRLLCFLRDNAAQSGFAMDAVELTIGDEAGDIPPLEVETPDGNRVRVTGQIDRVDVCQKDGKSYLCIVDYKTGTKQFSLDDVYCGLNMQMLIYLATLCKNGAARYPGAVPAGVLYLASDPAPATGRREGAAGPVFKLDGLVLADGEILKALDKTGEGLFVPVKHRDGKPLRAGKKLATLEKFGALSRHIEEMIAAMAEGVYGGRFPARPVVKQNRRPCDYCPYRVACRHEDGRNENTVKAPEGAFEPAEKGEEHGG